MKWLLIYLTSSIGKKQIMGAAGCLLVLFVLGHMVGNLQLLMPDPAEAQAAYNSYSNFLTKFKPMAYYAVIAGLAVIFAIHIYLAVALKLQNLKARGTARYAVEARKGKKQLPTFVMIWSGLAIIAFIVWHIFTVRNGAYYYYINPEVADGVVVRDMWLTTVLVLGNLFNTALYIFAILALSFHAWHAIASTFQTMGINHQKWMPIINLAGIAYCVVVGLGYGVTAAGAYAVVNLNEDAKKIIEQAQNPEYQEALKALHERPLEEQKLKAKAIAKNPERAKFIVENGSRGPKDMKGKPGHNKGHGRQKPEMRRIPLPEAETPQSEAPTEGGEQ